MKFTFGDIVVVEHNLIGVVVKCWSGEDYEFTYEVYVRDWNGIKTYPEDEIERYMVRHKELNEEEITYQMEALKNKDTKEDIDFKIKVLDMMSDEEGWYIYTTLKLKKKFVGNYILTDDGLKKIIEVKVDRDYYNQKMNRVVDEDGNIYFISDIDKIFRESEVNYEGEN